MHGADGAKVYDLEERTALFAQAVRRFVKTVPRSIANFEDVKQLVRASGSVGANYIEANEALGPKRPRDANADRTQRGERGELLAPTARCRRSRAMRG